MSDSTSPGLLSLRVTAECCVFSLGPGRHN